MCVVRQMSHTATYSPNGGGGGGGAHSTALGPKGGDFPVSWEGLKHFKVIHLIKFFLDHEKYCYKEYPECY